MPDIQLNDIPAEEVPHEDISMREIRKKQVVTERKYSVEHNEVSKNIQKFDKRPRVFKNNPYSFNSVSLKKVVPVTKSADQLVATPLYNLAGKVLGVDTIHDWGLHYDKVQAVVDWAQKKSGKKDPDSIIKFIYSKMNSVPSLGGSKLNDLYIYSGMAR